VLKLRKSSIASRHRFKSRECVRPACGRPVRRHRIDWEPQVDKSADRPRDCCAHRFRTIPAFYMIKDIIRSARSASRTNARPIIVSPRTQRTRSGLSSNQANTHGTMLHRLWHRVEQLAEGLDRRRPHRPEGEGSEIIRLLGSSRSRSHSLPFSIVWSRKLIGIGWPGAIAGSRSGQGPRQARRS
jgi:hypothetical protein